MVATRTRTGTKPAVALAPLVKRKPKKAPAAKAAKPAAAADPPKEAPAAAKKDAAKKTPAPKAAAAKPKGKKEAPAASAAAPAAAPAAAAAGSTEVVIEHCKQCNAFKTRALKVEEMVKKARPDATVTINPEKPRKGYFEIRVGSTVVLSLPSMQRPFPPLKALVMEDVGEKVIKAIPAK